MTDKVLMSLTELLEDKSYLQIPSAGDLVKGQVISIDKNEVRVAIAGFRTGVVRGPELREDTATVAALKQGDEIEATVLELENENGDVELSFRSAGAARTWNHLKELQKVGTIVPVKIVEANKGGLMASYDKMVGFLPVSQLSPEHYPRVSGGDKAKILERLKSYIGKEFNAKILDVNESEDKLIFSEKTVWEDEQKAVIAKFKVGDAVEGEITATTDFGAFMKFDLPEGGAGSLEGLIHISEIAWQRIDHPKDIISVGDKVKAEIIGIEGSKIFLSMKKLQDDPWKNISERYQVGQTIKGKILKANPFGFFVELDKDIHGLAHISELSATPIKDPSEVAKVGDELEWKIVSIEPEYHRLGLSLKAMKEPEVEEKKEETAAPEAKEEKKDPSSDLSSVALAKDETSAKEEGTKE
ncbi:S1 RNA-binding domain-containing protein [Candidatus Uhrbacteria bacterium]|nr:S1 RNA-binding domain-containing protein [Candidatus Uhrbacteria bacterium]